MTKKKHFFLIYRKALFILYTKKPTRKKKVFVFFS